MFNQYLLEGSNKDNVYKAAYKYGNSEERYEKSGHDKFMAAAMKDRNAARTVDRKGKDYRGAVNKALRKNYYGVDPVEAKKAEEAGRKSVTKESFEIAGTTITLI